MADKTITDLEYAPGSVNDNNTFFAVMQNGAAYKLSGSAFYTAMATMYNAHGAISSIEKTGASGLVDTYTITFADHTTTTFTVTNGNGITGITQYFARSTSGTTVPASGWSTNRQTLTSQYKYLWSYFVFSKDNGTIETPKAVIGAYGDTGLQTYVHIRYAASCSGTPPYPASNSDMSTSGDNWMGIYTGTSQTAPSGRTNYTWFKIKGEIGNPATLTGNSVTYQASVDSTVPPGGNWSGSIPYVSPGQYLWTRVVLTFNTGDPVTYYTVTRYAVDGQGAAGTETPLADSTNGDVGTSLSFARQDHRHPLPTASDIQTSTSGQSVQARLDSVTFDKIYPVGSIYLSTVSTSPATLFGVGTWERIQNRFLLAAGTSYAAGSTGGEATHKLTSAESGQKAVWTDSNGDHTHTATALYEDRYPTGTGRQGVWPGGTASSYSTSINISNNGAHTHSIPGSDATDAHNNMPPYLAVYMWKRTA